MASWLKAAEDLLEVVDRRAKLVASELSDELSDSQASVSKGQQIKSRKLKSKKDLPRKTVGRIGKSTEAELTQNSQEEFNLKIGKVDDSRNGNAPVVDVNHTSEVPSDARKDTETSNAALSGVIEAVEVRNANNELTVVSTTEINTERTNSTSNDNANVASFECVPESTLSSLLKGEGPENVDGNHLVDISSNGSAVIVDTFVAISEHDINDYQETEKSLFPEISTNTNRQLQNTTNSSPLKVEEQIDDAQGLLKPTVSTGHSKEARFVLGSLHVFKNTSQRMLSLKNFLLPRESLAVHMKLA